MHKINPHIFPLLPPDVTTGQVSGREVNECSTSSIQNAYCGIEGSVTQGKLEIPQAHASTVLDK